MRLTCILSLSPMPGTIRRTAKENPWATSKSVPSAPNLERVPTVARAPMGTATILPTEGSLPGAPSACVSCLLKVAIL